MWLSRFKKTLTGFAMLIAASGCNQVPTSSASKTGLRSGFQAAIKKVSPIAARAGDVVKLIGSDFDTSSTYTISHDTISAAVSVDVQDSETATFQMPTTPRAGLFTLKLMQDATNVADFELIADSTDSTPVFTGDASLICSTETFYDKDGMSRKGTKGCGSASANCSVDGAVGCVTTTSFPAAALSAADAANIKVGATIAGVAGSYSGSYSVCSSNGATGCVTTSTYKSADLTNLTAGNIKSGVTIAGQTGDFPSVTYPLSGASATADLTSATFDTKAASATAFEYWDSTGTRQTGAGDADLTAANIANGTTVFGVTGSLSGGGAFDTAVASNMAHNVGSTQMTLATEKSTSSYAAGYREIPDIFKDDTAFFGSASGCTNSGGASDSCTSAVWGTRPSTVCGTTQNTVTGRIADCLSKNAGNATWSGASKGISGEGTWKLVTNTGTAEVWRDERTGLLWSDKAPANDNWCKATGNAQSDDPSNICNSGTYQDQTTPYSYCVEDGSHQSPLTGENWTTGVYHDMKGGMGAVSTSSSPAVRWRLPTRADWMQADINGVRLSLPNMTIAYWTATIYDSLRQRANYFIANSGTHAASSSLATVARTGNNGIRCVGRAP